jgi:hypothetical protein
MNWRGTIWAAWLGLLALAVNALVPVHLAFDLAEALGPTPQHPIEDEVGGAERQLLALISGHREADGRADEHGRHKHGRDKHGQPHQCPVCSALGALTGLAPPVLVALPVSDAAGLPAALPAADAEPVGTPAGYRSRAPPIA